MHTTHTVVTAAAAALIAGVASAAESKAADLTQVRHHFEKVGDVNVFYREAGDPAAPTVLLLHGFAASSYMYRDLIPALSDRYHVVAPDLPSFGFTHAPDRSKYSYTFDNIASTMNKFTEQLKLERYAIVVHDYGAPVGWRRGLETRHFQG